MTTYAGNKYPMKIYQLPNPLGPVGIKKKRDLRKHCGPYYQNEPRPLDDKSNGHPGGSFYLNSDFEPGRYWKYADTISNHIRHTGWYIDCHCNETIRGIVIYLPHNRFLAGWTMGEGMISEYDGQLFDDETDAAWAADECARIAADHERTYLEEHEQEEMED